MKNCIHILDLLGYAKYPIEMQKADIFVHPRVTASDRDTTGGAPIAILEPHANRYACHFLPFPEKTALLTNERNYISPSNQTTTLMETKVRWQDLGIPGAHLKNSIMISQKKPTTVDDKFLQLIHVQH